MDGPYLIIYFSFISVSSSIGTSEEELKVHFKEKHKINTVKPFLIKRICRICDYDKSTSNDQLVKHITDEHPRSDYGDEDEGKEIRKIINNHIADNWENYWKSKVALPYKEKVIIDGKEELIENFIK